jgi:two-component system LytT family response regulator
MSKVVIIDDEPLARSIVKEYLQQHPQLQIAQECNDGFEGVKAIQQHEPDLIFLDIQMPKINGFEMLELIEQRPAVIFTTAFDEYAIKAFEAHAIDYLLKPFDQARFDKAIAKWTEQKNTVPENKREELLETASQSPAQSQRIVVKNGSKIKIIPVHDVFYLEAADDYVKIHTKEGYFLKNKTMNHFEQVLDQQQFVRSHRSYIVNVQQITRIDPYEKDNHVAVLRSGAKVPVSRGGYGKFFLKNDIPPAVIHTERFDQADPITIEGKQIIFPIVVGRKGIGDIDTVTAANRFDGHGIFCLAIIIVVNRNNILHWCIRLADRGRTTGTVQVISGRPVPTNDITAIDNV